MYVIVMMRITTVTALTMVQCTQTIPHLYSIGHSRCVLYFDLYPAAHLISSLVKSEVYL